MRKAIVILVMTVVGAGLLRMEAEPLVEVDVAQYRYGNKCAVSLTFDDGIQEDYTLIAPHLNVCGLKGTFCINGAFIGDLDDRFAPRLTWEQCREMARDGHEIASHSWSHINEFEAPLDVTLREIAMNDSAIEREVGARPLTYFFPFNGYTQQALEAAMKDRLACRLYQYPLGQRNNHVTWEGMTAWLQEQINGGKWGVTMTHGIFTAWDQWEEPWLLWDFFRLLEEKAGTVWTGTFAEVAAYVTERDSVQLIVTSDNGEVRAKPHLSLNPQFYTIPLTLVISNLSNNIPIEVTQDGRILPLLRNGDQTFVEFDPYGGEIVIRQKTGAKRLAVLGDSYSTMAGWISPYNSEPFFPRFNVQNVEQTWWHMVISSGDYVLECNNSYSGSTMTNNTLPNWRDRHKKMLESTSFISRCMNLGNPDIILICGGTNDEWNNDHSMGDYKWAEWSDNDLKLFRPGTAYLMNLIKTTYPQAKICFVLNDILPRVSESIKIICAHYGITVIEPQGIEKDQTGHPTAQGMETIAQAVINELQSKNM